MKTVFPGAPAPIVPVAGSDSVFPVHRIYCVGRNYADHAREMGHDPTREPPFFFSKPADAVVCAQGADGTVAVRYPLATGNLHPEVELVVALQSGGENLAVDAALSSVFGYAVGLDLTRRDIQGRAKEKGHPWDMGKGFDQSAPLSALVPAGACGHPQRGAITLAVNGAARQAGDLAQMSWKVAEVIAELSRYVELKAGDLIFTGTPAGVGPAARGDRLEAVIEGVGRLSARLV